MQARHRGRIPLPASLQQMEAGRTGNVHCGSQLGTDAGRRKRLGRFLVRLRLRESLRLGSSEAAPAAVEAAEGATDHQNCSKVNSGTVRRLDQNPRRASLGYR